MPIVQDPDKRSSIEVEFDSAMQRFAEESIRTEFCDGPVDVPGWNKPEPARDTMACNEGGARTSDRAELMARIKRGESPTWVPKQPVRRKHGLLRSTKFLDGYVYLEVWKYAFGPDIVLHDGLSMYRLL